MFASTVAVSPQQRRVLEILRAHPKGVMIEQIREQSGFTNEIIYAALHVLARNGTVVGRSPFAYVPNVVDTDPEDDSEK